MRDTKRQLPIFSFYDLTGMERHLQAQAAKGWMLESITGFGWTYRRCEPKDTHFAVTYCTGASATEKPQAQRALEASTSEDGWQFQAAGANLVVFTNDALEPEPFHTNIMQEINVMEEAGKFTSLAWLLMVVVTGSNGLLFLTRLLRDTIGLLADAMSIVSGISMSLLCLYFLAEMFTWARWKKKARAFAVKGGGMLPTHGHHGFLTGVVVLFLVGAVYVLIADRQPGLRFMLLALCGILLALCCVVRGVSALARKEKKVGTAAVSFLLTVAILGSLGYYFVSADLSHVRSDLELELTVEQLTGKDFDDTDVRQVTPRSSLFLTDVRCVQKPTVAEGEEWPKGRSLSYRVIDVHLPMLTSRCQSQLLHQYDDMGKSKPGADRSTANYVFHPLDNNPFGAEEAYQRYAYDEAQSHFLLCWKGRFVEIETDWMLTDAQMATVGDMLAPAN